jgi:ketosteroid isomerase-like protein
MLRSDIVSRTLISVALFLLIVSLSTACQTQSAPATSTDTRAADEASLKATENEWSKAAGTKDVEKTVAFYGDDAVVLPPNSPVLTGKVSIRAMWKTMQEAPGFSIHWQATKVEVARSGDIAYTSGSYEWTQNDSNGKPMTEKGKYLEAWKKQTDSSWKCVADMFSSDLPVPTAAESKAASGRSK